LILAINNALSEALEDCVCNYKCQGTESYEGIEKSFSYTCAKIVVILSNIEHNEQQYDQAYSIEQTPNHLINVVLSDELIQLLH